MTETEKMPFLCVRFRLLRIDLVGRHPFDFQQSACGSAPHGSFMPLPNRLASLQTDSSVPPLRVKETNRPYNRHRVTFTMARTAAVPQPLPENSRVERAADAASEIVIGDPVPEPYREQAGQAVHYLVGGVLGGIYGVLAEYKPEASAGFGSAYGIATSALLDEGAVPAAGLAPPPTETSLVTHMYGTASHLVYGWVLESARALIAGRG